MKKSMLTRGKVKGMDRYSLKDDDTLNEMAVFRNNQKSELEANQADTLNRVSSQIYSNSIYEGSLD